MATKHSKVSTAKTVSDAPDANPSEAKRLYYLEHMGQAIQDCLMIESKYQQGALVPWTLNPPQKALDKLWEDIRAFNRKRTKELNKLDPNVPISDGPVRICCVKPRQGGVSSYVQARFLLYCQWLPNFKANVTAHQVNSTQKVIAKARRYHNEWRGPIGLRYQTDAAGKNQLSWAHGSFMQAATAGSEDSERGTSYDAGHFSEAAYFPSWTGVNATLGAMTAWATELYESTGNGESGAFYEKFKGAMFFEDVVRMFKEKDEARKAKWNGFFRFFFAWFDDPGARKPISRSEADYISKTLTDKERELVETHGCDMANIAWRRDTIKTRCQKQPGMDPEEYFAQEWPATWQEAFASRGSKFFKPAWLEPHQRTADGVSPLLHAMITDTLPPVKASVGAANLRVFERPEPHHLYVVSIDSAEGAGGDYAVITVGDRTFARRRRVAMFRSKMVEPNAVTDIAVALAEWFNFAWIINENTGAYGRTVSQRLIDNQYPYLYFEERFGAIKQGVPSRTSHTVGYSVSNQHTRGRLLADLQTAVRDQTWEIIDNDAMDEYRAFEIIDGKAQAPEGDNDDIVLADALCVQFMNRLGVPDPREVANTREVVEKIGIGSLAAALRRKVAKDDAVLKRKLGKSWQPRDERRP